MTTASSLFDATAVNFMPLGVCGGSVDDGGVAAGCRSFPHAARTEPAPTASTAMPPACSTERRDTALAMSPKYSLPLVLRTGLEQASPHLYRHVTCCRLDFPSWVMKRFSGTTAMHGFLPNGLRPGLLAESAETYVKMPSAQDRISNRVARQPPSSPARMSTSARGWSP